MNNYMPNKLRHVFNNQPGQYVIIDVGFPMSNKFLEETKKAIQNVLCLANSIQGSSRVPCFGIFLLNNILQPILKLISVKGKCSKFLTPLNSISNMMQINGRISMAEFNDFMHFALVSALDNFQEYCKTMASKNIHETPSQLQITVVSAKNGSDLQTSIETIVPNLNIAKLKKIQIIQLLEEDTAENMNINKNQTNDFVELIKVKVHENTLEDIFKTWLINDNRDYVQVNIKLPGLLLKCDMVDCLINVNSLNCASRLQLQTDVPSNKYDMDNYTVMVNEVPFYELEIINRLSSDALDESLLFGQPIGLIPTKCFVLNPSEIQYNKQCFSGLCQSLLTGEEYLIAKVQTPREMPCGHFVILPGPGMLLVKSLATKELVLPTPNTEIEEISQHTMNAVGNCLAQIYKLQEYDGSQIHSGLYTALTHVEKKGPRNSEASTSMKISTPKKTKGAEDMKHSIIVTKYSKKKVEMFTKPKNSF